MSIVKNKKFGLVVLLALCSLAIFGCTNTVSVDNIYFDDGMQTVFLVGDSYTPSITVTPSYASDTSYTITTSDSSVVEVSNNTLYMKAAGTALIKVTANSNSQMQDRVSITVKSNPETLLAPTNLAYNASTQTFSFSTVSAAGSYTLSINNTEINLGNTNTYTLSQYQALTGQAYDTVLSVKVRANAPTNSSAYDSSDYGEAILIYQNSAASDLAITGGVLTFSTSASTTNYNIYFDGKLIDNVTTSGDTHSYSLTALSADYAGLAGEITVESVVDSNASGLSASGATTYNAMSDGVKISVLGVPSVALSGTTISWPTITGADSYSLYIGGNFVTTISQNYYDLTSLDNYDSYSNVTDGYTLYVDTNLSSTSENLAKTSKVSNTITFNRLATPTVSISSDGSTIVWSEVEDTFGYMLKLYKGDTLLMNTTVTDTSRSMSNYEAGTYTLYLTAVGGYNSTEGIYYLTSTEVSYSATKLAAVSDHEISNYKLAFSATSGEKFLITFLVDDTDTSDTEVNITADSNTVSLDLSTYNFSAGEHTIHITKISGTDADGHYIYSDTVELTFTQLKAVEASITAGVMAQYYNYVNSQSSTAVTTADEGDDSEGDNTDTGSGDTGSGDTGSGDTGSGDTGSDTGSENDPTEEEVNFDISFSSVKDLLQYFRSTLTITLGDNSLDSISLSISKTGGSTLNFTSSDLTDNGDGTVSLSLNTVDTTLTDYLSAGSYTISINVTGNGSSTFSVKTATTLTFDVCETSALSPVDNCTCVLELTPVDDSDLYHLVRFYTYDGKTYYPDMTSFITRVEDDSSTEDDNTFSIYPFDVVKGYLFDTTDDAYAPDYTAVTGYTYLIISMGDGVTALSSAAAYMQVDKLATPTLTFDGTDITISDTNSAGVASYTVSYGASQTYTGSKSEIEALLKGYSFSDGENVFTITATADTGSDGQYYLDSGTYTLTITKITADAKVAINTDNQIVITKYVGEYVDTTKYDLQLNLKIDSTTYTFVTQSSGVLYCSALNASLNYTFSEGVYTITIMDDYTPLLSVMEGITSFSISMKFSSSDSTILDSVETDAFSISFATASTLSASGNEIILSKVSEYNYTYYVLIINDQYYYDLTSSASVYDDTPALGVSISDLIEYISSVNSSLLSVEFTIKAVTLNRASSSDNLIVANVGSEIYVKVLSGITPSITKDNTSATSDNTTTVSFSTVGGGYNPTYTVSFYSGDSASEGGGTLKNSTTFSNSDDTTSSGSISFVLDDYVSKYSITGQFYITIALTASGTDTGEHTSYVFGALTSSAYNFTVLDTVSDISVSEGTLLFGSVENAVGYNIYSVADDGNLTKLNNYLFTDVASGYALPSLTGGYTLVVRAISASTSVGDGYYYVNSYDSAEVTIYKLSTPTVSISSDKDIVLSVSLAEGEVITSLINDSSVNVYLRVYNAYTDTTTNISLSNNEGVTFDVGTGASITIIPSTLIQYGVSSVVGEELTFTIVVDYDLSSGTETEDPDSESDPESGSDDSDPEGQGEGEGDGSEGGEEQGISLASEEGEEGNTSTSTTYYLSSDSVSATFYGLLEVSAISVTKTTLGTDNNNTLNYITWTDHTANSGLTYGYIIEVIYNSTTYSSASGYLYYLSYVNGETTYTAYPSIITDASGTKYLFVAGYDSNEDGTLSKDELFSSGSYTISIIVVPTTGYNTSDTFYLSSTNTYSYTVYKLETPSVFMSEGSVVWNMDTAADSFVVNIYDMSGTLKSSVIDTSGVFDFSADTYAEYVGFYYVTVQAISSKSYVVNSNISEQLVVYRMDPLTSVTVEDGNLVLTASQYYSQLELTFTDTQSGSTSGFKYITLYSYNDSATDLLTNAFKSYSSWVEVNKNNALESATTTLSTAVGQTIYISGSTIMSLLNGRTYTLSIRLVGNSNAAFAIASSVETTVSLNTTKLATATISVSEGALTFGSSATFASGVNYDFTTSGSSLTASWGDFWSDTYVYQITFTIGSNDVCIYAVDYNTLSSYITAGTLTSGTHYVEYDSTIQKSTGLWGYVIYAFGSTKIYFNVYENNTLDFNNDSIAYLPLTITDTKGVYTYTSVSNPSTGYTSLDLVSGGSFVVSVSILGGDEITDSNLGLVSSNINMSSIFMRYGENTLWSDDGYVAFYNLQYVDGQTVDNPVYRLTVTIGGVDSIVYLYDKAYYTKDTVEAVLYDDDYTNYYVPIIFSDTDEETGMKEYIYYDMSEFSAGKYTISVQALAGFSTEGITSDYILDARTPEYTYAFSKLNSPSISASTTTTGALTITLGTYYDTSTYVYDYEITITHGDVSYVYTIGKDSEGVSISNGTMTYTLPDEIVLDNGETLQIEDSESYTITAKALATTSTNTINSSASASKAFTTAQGVRSVAISGGVITWTVSGSNYSSYKGVNILISWTDSASGEVAYISLTDTSSYTGTGTDEETGETYYIYTYTIGDSTFTTLGGKTETIDSGIKYTISISCVGNSTDDTIYLNSTYSEGVYMYRVERIDSTYIVSTDGVLTWSGVSYASTYEITITDSNGNTVYSASTQETSLNLDELLSAGSYTVSIRALTTEAGYLNSRWSATSATFTKLAAVDSTSIKTDLSTVSWTAVTSAQGYQVTFYSGKGEDKTWVSEVKVDTNSCTFPSLSGTYTIEIRAIGIEQGYVFNGPTITFESSADMPKEIYNLGYGLVDAGGSENQYLFYWQADEDSFFATDSFYIIYDLAAYTDQNGSLATKVSQQVSISYADAIASMVTIDGTKYYCYAPTVMGQYTTFTVYVLRGSGTSNSSNPVTAEGGLDLRIYSYGSGTESDPYYILNMTQLLNIKYFPASHFALGGSVNLSSIDYEAQLANYNALIYSTFTGTLNGNGFVIYGLPALSFTDVYSFSLFNTLSGATITNLQLGNTDDARTISFAYTYNNNSKDISVGLLAASATDSSISGVYAYAYTYTFSGTHQTTVYLAGLIAYAESCTITDTTVLKVTFVLNNTNNSGYVYVGGVVANAKYGSFAGITVSTEVKTTLSGSSNSSLMDYFGGVVAYFSGSDDKSSSITGSTATSITTSTISVTGVKFNRLGGLAGRTTYITIKNCETFGSVSYTSLSSDSVSWGGLVGWASSTDITSCGTGVTFSVSLTTTVTYFYVGAIAGTLTISGSVTGSVSDCYSYYKAELSQGSTITSGSITLGIYGQNTSSTSVTVQETLPVSSS